MVRRESLHWRTSRSAMTWRPPPSATCGYLRHYYGFAGEYAEMIAGGALRGAEAIKGALTAYEDAGVDELILDPTVADLSQVERLADLVL
jgi:hypothetical protein